MSVVSDILATDKHFSVRYIRQRIDKIPTSTSPYHPFGDPASSVYIYLNSSNYVLASQYLKEDTTLPSEDLDNKQSPNVPSPSQIDVKVDKLSEVPSSTNNIKKLERTVGGISPKCMKATIIIGISLLIAAIVAASVVVTLMLLKI